MPLLRALRARGSRALRDIIITLALRAAITLRDITLSFHILFRHYYYLCCLILLRQRYAAITPWYARHYCIIYDMTYFFIIISLFSLRWLTHYALLFIITFHIRTLHYWHYYYYLLLLLPLFSMTLLLRAAAAIYIHMLFSHYWYYYAAIIADALPLHVSHIFSVIDDAIRHKDIITLTPLTLMPPLFSLFSAHCFRHERRCCQRAFAAITLFIFFLHYADMLFSSLLRCRCWWLRHAACRRHAAAADDVIDYVYTHYWYAMLCCRHYTPEAFIICHTTLMLIIDYDIFFIIDDDAAIDYWCRWLLLMPPFSILLIRARPLIIIMLPSLLTYADMLMMPRADVADAIIIIFAAYRLRRCCYSVC